MSGSSHLPDSQTVKTTDRGVEATMSANRQKGEGTSQRHVAMGTQGLWRVLAGPPANAWDRDGVPAGLDATPGELPHYKAV